MSFAHTGGRRRNDRRLRSSTLIGIVVREYAQERDLPMPIIEINEKLTRVIRGRSIELLIQEAGLHATCLTTPSKTNN
jgi:hypothetical protein